MVEATDIAFMVLVGVLVLAFLCDFCCFERRNQAADREAAQQQRAAAAATAEVALAALAARPVVLPYFSWYAPPPSGGGGAAAPPETTDCAICLEPLRGGQLCSEVPACRHAFHRDCLGQWVRSNASCPVCRAAIVLVPGSHAAAAAADDMV